MLVVHGTIRLQTALRLHRRAPSCIAVVCLHCIAVVLRWDADVVHMTSLELRGGGKLVTCHFTCLQQSSHFSCLQLNSPDIFDSLQLT